MFLPPKSKSVMSPRVTVGKTIIEWYYEFTTKFDIKTYEVFK